MNTQQNSADSVEARVISNIRPHFQPIVSSSDHNVYAFEALLRIPGVTMCDALFRRWEATGEVVNIDTTMVRRVRATLDVHGSDVAVSVNASALTVALAPEPYLSEIAALARVARRVVVEVTETFPILELSALARFAGKCKDLGVGIALDDCTTHHEFCVPDALEYVRPDILKIDGTFLNECFQSRNDRPIADLVGLARRIGAAVVAEHVAAQETCDWAVALGANLLQGFYFGAAKPLAETLSISTHHPRGITSYACHP